MCLTVEYIEASSKAHYVQFLRIDILLSDINKTNDVNLSWDVSSTIEDVAPALNEWKCKCI